MLVFFQGFYSDYFVIFFFLVVALLLSLILFFCTYTLNTGTKVLGCEKSSAYECVFDPVDDSRIAIDMKFYKVAILFIVFDIEIIFLFPWSVIVTRLQMFSVLTSWLFILILLVGLYLKYTSELIVYVYIQVQVLLLFDNTSL